jgi:hypothetical protein
LECFLRERQVDGITVRLAPGDSRGPVDLDHLPLRVLEVEGNRHTVVEGHLDRHATTEDPLVHSAEIRQRPHLEGGVLVGAVGEERQVVGLLDRTAAEEGGVLAGDVCGVGGDVFLSLPCVICREGVQQRLMPELDEDETTLLRRSAATLRDAIRMTEHLCRRERRPAAARKSGRAPARGPWPGVDVIFGIAANGPRMPSARGPQPGSVDRRG